MKILTIFGTRPEIIRLSLIIQKFDNLKIKNILVHTGQNFNPRLSDIFFKELKIRQPDYYLGIREKTVGAQIGEIIKKSEEIILKEKPNLLLILGDTNSGLSAISAARHNVPILHMEAGNRCFDWRVPEEKNRKIIDHISTWLCPYTTGSRDNLIREGIDPKKIFISGNPITEVIHYHEKFEQSDILEKLKLKTNDYFLVTLHREENVDNLEIFKIILKGLKLVAKKYKKRFIWSLHPRTRSRIKKYKISLKNLGEIYQPFGFYEFLKLEKNARCVFTDSGTVQEECSLFKTPTVTIRETTERPETVECGSNILSGTTDPWRILSACDIMLRSDRQWISPYEKDLDVSDRIIKFINNIIKK